MAEPVDLALGQARTALRALAAARDALATLRAQHRRAAARARVGFAGHASRRFEERLAELSARVLATQRQLAAQQQQLEGAIRAAEARRRAAHG